MQGPPCRLEPLGPPSPGTFELVHATAVWCLGQSRGPGDVQLQVQPFRVHHEAEEGLACLRGVEVSLASTGARSWQDGVERGSRSSLKAMARVQRSRGGHSGATAHDVPTAFREGVHMSDGGGVKWRLAERGEAAARARRQPEARAFGRGRGGGAEAPGRLSAPGGGLVAGQGCPEVWHGLGQPQPRR